MTHGISERYFGLALIAALAVFFPNQSWAQFSSCVNVQQAQMPSPHGVGGTAYGSSRLDPYVDVLIEQVEKVPAISPGDNYVSNQQVCHVLHNTGNQSFFVPWNSIPEWSDFLAAANYTPLKGTDGQPHILGKGTIPVTVGICCKPQVVTLCDNNHSQVQLGYYVLGTPTVNPVTQQPFSVTETQNGAPITDLNHWGFNAYTIDKTQTGAVVPNPTPHIITNDSFGPICMDTNGAGQAIQYQVTWTCSTDGSWVKSREVGSCTPTDGGCALTNGISLSALPSDYQTLCTTGSIFENLITLKDKDGNLTGWQWECAGTPNMQSASCNAVYSSSTSVSNGKCGYTGASVSTLSASDPNLCIVGAPQGFSGTGPWSWTCTGTNGGKSTVCQASQSAGQAAVCGTVDTGGGSYTAAQLSNFASTDPLALCAQGVFDTSYGFQGGGIYAYFNYYCRSTDGVSPNAQCSAYNAVIDGACGRENGVTYNTTQGNPPLKGLCKYQQESVNSLVYNTATDTWTWTCSGIGGGTTSPQCSAYFNATAVQGQCGSATSTPQVTVTGSTPGLCTTGTATNIQLDGSQWTWTCQGSGGATSAQCSTLNPAAPGRCGNAYQNPTATAPVRGLCSYGTAIPSPPIYDSASNNWLWSCQGATGTAPTSCYAPAVSTIQSAVCGAATATPTVTAPTTSLCSVGTATAVTSNSATNSWDWNCTISGGNSASCSVSQNPTVNNGSTVVNGVCGNANGVTSTTSPGSVATSTLCTTGSATVPTGDFSTATWNWVCSGSGGGTSMPCTGYMATANGVCGAANGVVVPNEPNSGGQLCASGAASAVSGNALYGPWSWTCSGIGPSTTSQTCGATYCVACTGNAASSSSITQVVQVIDTITKGACNITETAQWTETDALSPSGSFRNYTMSWTDVFGTHSNIMAPNLSGVCMPCFASFAGATMPSVSITAASGPGCKNPHFAVGTLVPVTSFTAQ